MEKQEYFLDQLKKIIVDYNSLKQKTIHNDFSDYTEDIYLLIAKAKATVQRTVGIESEYYKEIIRILGGKDFDGNKVKPIIGIVLALKEDLESNYLKSIGEIVHSEIFTDYLEMAEYLLSEGYKDASAVIAGSTLESHLRSLCSKHSISISIEKTNGKATHKKADLMNSELYKKSAYSSSVHKQITAWLDLRNDAAHGKYEKYKHNEVDLMIKGILNFIAFCPA